MVAALFICLGFIYFGLKEIKGLRLRTAINLKPFNYKLSKKIITLCV